MLERLIEACVKNRFLILLMTGFVVAVGVWAMLTTPVDAIPDLSDVQVIIAAEWMGQSPQEVEDQITYPITTAMLGVPKVKTVRGYSFFSASFVYVIFQDGTDLYWARSRVMEYLNALSGRLPRGVATSLGPDATGVGWVYEYSVESDRHNLGDLRAVQDWYIRYQLLSVPGVSEVASLGGFKKQYQIDLDPNRLLAYDIPIGQVVSAVQRSNQQIGASMLEMAEREYMIRGLGYIKSLDEIRQVAVGANANGTPIRVADIATVHEGPEMRRGIAEKDGTGEVVGGIVVMRQGENALKVIQAVKKKIEEISPGLPEGVRIVSAYDRSGLIHHAIETLKETLTKESLTVAVVIALFLWHLKSSLVAVVTLPVGVLLSFVVMRFQGLNANIMSLGGIAVAIGAMVDASIVMVENVHKVLEHDRHEGRERNLWEVVVESSKQVGPSLFFSLVIIAVSFLPVFTLEAQEGRLFRPLAFTKTYAMAAGAILAVTLVPVLMGYLIRGRLADEGKNPLNRVLIRLYRPTILPILKWRWAVVGVAVLLLAATYVPLKQLGSEFMPPLDEGDLLYMPNTGPGVSVTQARQVLQIQNQTLRQVPEVRTVFGKIGRAETATDPAGLDMVETVIALKPREEWRKGMTTDKLIAELDAKLKMPGTGNVWTMPIKTRVDMLATGIKTPVGVKVYGNNLEQVTDTAMEIEEVLRQVPGTRNVFAERLMSGNYVDFEINRETIARYGLTVADVQATIQSAVGGMPITTTVEGRNRFSVNVRYARDLREDIEKLRRVLVPLPTSMGGGMTSGAMASASGMGGDSGMGGMESGGGVGTPMPAVGSAPAPSVSRFGLPLSAQASMGIVSGMGGEMSGGGMSSGMGGGPMSGGMSSTGSMFGGGMGTTPSGGAMGSGFTATPMPNLPSSRPRIAHIPLGDLAAIFVRKGPMSINSEGGLLRSIVFVDVATKDIGGYVREAQKVVAANVTLPQGVYIAWSGQFEYMERAAERLKIIVPLTLVLIFVLLYLNFKNLAEALIVMLSLPFAAIGGVWLMYLFKFNMSVATGVGFIALAGLAVATAIVMLLFLDISYDKLRASGRPLTRATLYGAIIEGAALRVRPKMMTVAVATFGLVPIFWEEGAGSDVMRRMAAPMIGGLVSSLVLTLIVIPAIYAIWKGRGLEGGVFEASFPPASKPKSRFGLFVGIVLLGLAAVGGLWLSQRSGGDGQLLTTQTVGDWNAELYGAGIQAGKTGTLRLRLTDAAGEPVSDAEVKMEVFMAGMPAMGMPEYLNREKATFKQGRYEAKLPLESKGAWDFTATISRNGETREFKFPLVVP